MKSTQFTYDNLNRVTQIQDAINGLTAFTYDPNGNLLSVTDAKSQTTTYTYDNMDRLATRKDALNRTESYQYDLASNLTTFTDRKNQVATFQYDALNRRTSATYADATTTFTYDAAGRLVKASDTAPGVGTIDFAYDVLDRLIQETTPQGTVAYQYDVLGRRTQMTANGQQPTSHQYDAASRLTRVEQGSLFAALGYDNANRRTSLTYPNGTTTSYAYDLASRLTNITHNGPSGIIDALTYAYDTAGNRFSASRANGTASLLPSAVASAAYDAANEQTQFAGATLTYDGNGNLTNDGTNTYQWDARNRLAGITGGATASFGYDVLGRRVSRAIAGEPLQFLYDRSDIVSEIRGGGIGTSYLRSLNVDEAFIRQTATGNEQYHTDVLGNTLGLTDGAAASIATYSYEAFGKTTVAGNSSNLFQYSGRENDGASLYFLRARYYNPSLHRFVSEDPMGFAAGDSNLYSYVGNNPANNTDVFGLCKIEVKFNPLGPGYYHAHIVTTDPGGFQIGFRGGPGGIGPSGGSSGALSSGSGGSVSQKSPGRGGSSNSSNTSSPGSGPGGPGNNTGPWGPLTPTIGPYGPQFIDYPNAGGPLPSMTVLNNSQSCTNYQTQFAQNFLAVQQANIPYNPLSTNSNALIQNTLTNSGLSPGQPPVWAPGWNTPLRY